MALSMDEERILTEMASHLSEDDPVLARRFARFGRVRERRRGHTRLIMAVVLAIVVVGAAVAVTVAIAAT